MEGFDARGHNRVYVDGGAIIPSILKAALNVDIRITLFAILIGEGIRIFGETEDDGDLELASVCSSSSGLVDLNYRPKYGDESFSTWSVAKGCAAPFDSNDPADRIADRPKQRRECAIVSHTCRTA